MNERLRSSDLLTFLQDRIIPESLEADERICGPLQVVLNENESGQIEFILYDQKPSADIDQISQWDFWEDVPELKFDDEYVYRRVLAHGYLSHGDQEIFKLESFVVLGQSLSIGYESDYEKWRDLALIIRKHFIDIAEEYGARFFVHIDDFDLYVNVGDFLNDLYMLEQMDSGYHYVFADQEHDFRSIMIQFLDVSDINRYILENMRDISIQEKYELYLKSCVLTQIFSYLERTFASLEERPDEIFTLNEIILDLHGVLFLNSYDPQLIVGIEELKMLYAELYERRFNLLETISLQQLQANVVTDDMSHSSMESMLRNYPSE